MYQVFELLLEKHGITAYRFCKDTGINASTISTWKKKNSIARPELAKTICDYFGISMDYLMTGKESVQGNQPVLTPKNERDIARKLEETLAQLASSQEALMFDGEPLDERTRELLMASLENSIRIAKIDAKEKFTPKKYK